MFGRKKQSAPADPTPGATAYVERAGAKNRPTPRRRDQEAARKRPLVPADRKAAAREARQRMASDRARQRAAMLTGDEAHLPARDRGPVRRYLRDAVDTRWNIGEFLLPMMVVILLVSLLPGLRTSRLLLAVYLLVYAVIILAVLDALLLARRLTKRARERYGADAMPRGSAMYVGMRAFQIRRTRLPRPMIKRGEKPA